MKKRGGSYSILINIMYARGLAVYDGIGGHVAPTLFRCKGMAVLANHDKDRRLSRFHDNFRGSLPHLVTPDEQVPQHGYSTEILAEFLA